MPEDKFTLLRAIFKQGVDNAKQLSDLKTELIGITSRQAVQIEQLQIEKKQLFALHNQDMEDKVSDLKGSKKDIWGIMQSVAVLILMAMALFQQFTGSKISMRTENNSSSKNKSQK